jgi:hypothetical protein
MGGFAGARSGGAMAADENKKGAKKKSSRLFVI